VLPFLWLNIHLTIYYSNRYPRVRKELKIRPGFTPQEDAVRFRGTRQQTAEQNVLPRGHIPGWVAPSSETRVRRGGRPGASTSSTVARSLDALASGNTGIIASKPEIPVSKNAKKSAKRSEKKKEEKQKALEEKIRAAWDDDSDEDIPRPAKKGKAPAPSSGPDEERDVAVDPEEATTTIEKPEGSEDDTYEVAEKVSGLTI